MIRATVRRTKNDVAEPSAPVAPRLEPLDPRFDANAIMRLFERGDRTMACFESHREEFRKSYPDEWVLVGPDGLIAHSKSRSVVIRAARRHPANDSLHMELVSATRRTLIL